MHLVDFAESRARQLGGKSLLVVEKSRQRRLKSPQKAQAIPAGTVIERGQQLPETLAAFCRKACQRINVS